MKLPVEIYELIFSGANDGIIGVDIKTKKFMFVNPKICEITGYSSGELLKLGIKDIHPKKDLSYVEDAVKKQIQGKLDIAEDIPVLKKDKNIVYCDVSSRAIKFEGQEILVGFFREMTEQKKAQDELKNSEERMRILFECAPDAIYLTDMKGNLVDGNKAVERLSGYKKDEMLGKNLLNLGVLQKDQLPKVIGLLAKNKLGLPTKPIEIAMTKKDGSHAVVEVSTFSVKMGGKPMSLGIARDVTERKKTEEYVKTSETNYRTIFNAANDAIFVYDIETGKIIDANQSVYDMYGYTPKGVMELSLDALSSGNPPYSQKEGLQFFKKASTGNPQVFEWLAKKKSGKLFWVEMSLKYAMIKNRGCIMAVVRDITERKRAKKTVEESEEKFRNLFENASDGIIYLDNSGRILDVNKRGIEIFGGSKEALMGKNFMKLGLFSPRDIPMLMRNFAGIVENKKNTINIQFANKKGQIVYLECLGSLMKIDHRTDGIMVVVRDVTERKKADEDMKKRNEELEKFHNLAVDRELKMIELKKVIEKLEKKGDF